MTTQEFNQKLLKIHLISLGMKKHVSSQGGPVLPKADLYIDCRVIDEEGIKGTSGYDEEFIAGVKTKSAQPLVSIFNLILQSFQRVPTRRKNEDPYAKPYVVCFMCAWGVHRSVATKNIIFNWLKKSGFDVKMVN